MHARKLRAKLTDWSAAGLITAEQAAAIGEYEDRPRGRNWGMLIFAGFGAVILPANGHTLYLQIQASWSGPVVETVRAAEKTPLTDAELRILPPGKGITVEMPVPQRWLEVLEKNEDKPFRLLYTAPGTEACAHLEHAEAIWRGRLESQGLGSRQLWEQ